MHLRIGTVLSATCLVTACVGQIEPLGSSSPSTDPDAADWGTDDGACAGGSLFVPLARLTSHELARTLESLLPETTLAAIEGELAIVPDDGAGKDLDSVARDITASHVRAHVIIADAVGAHLASDIDARSAVAPCFATTGERDCVAELVAEWGARAWRRPLEDAEVAETMALHDRVAAVDGPAHALRAVVSSILLAPAFVLRVELGDGGSVGESVGDEIVLGPFELAARLSYVLWGDAPDEALREAAADGRIDDPYAFADEVDRMLADDRARSHLSHLVTQWLLLDRDLGIDDVTGPRASGVVTTGLSAAAVEEIRRLVEHLVWNEGAGLEELMTTDLSFVGHPGLAMIYGMPESGWETPVSLGDERRGLLSRVFMLADPGGEQHPIYRGRRVREQLLCGTLYLPDPDTLPEGSLEDPPVDPEESSRERYERHTSAPECAGCHQLINPLGFALGGFDGLGVRQTTERILDDEGRLLGEVPVDTAVDPVLVMPGEHHVDGAVELGALLGRERVANECAAARWLEAAVGRKRAAPDGCTVDAMADLLSADDGGFIAMIRHFVQSPAFRGRRLEP